MESRILSRTNRHKTLGLLALAAGIALVAQVTAEGKVSSLVQSTITTSPVH